MKVEFKEKNGKDYVAPNSTPAQKKDVGNVTFAPVEGKKESNKALLIDPLQEVKAKIGVRFYSSSLLIENLKCRLIATLSNQPLPPLNTAGNDIYLAIPFNESLVEIRVVNLGKGSAIVAPGLPAIIDDSISPPLVIFSSNMICRQLTKTSASKFVNCATAGLPPSIEILLNHEFLNVVPALNRLVITTKKLKQSTFNLEAFPGTDNIVIRSKLRKVHIIFLF